MVQDRASHSDRRNRLAQHFNDLERPPDPHFKVTLLYEVFVVSFHMSIFIAF